MRRLELDKNWTMKMVDGNESFDALVPGSVYGDLLSAGKMEDPFWKDNEEAALKLMDEDYEYSVNFKCDEDLLGKTEVLLVFEGLDTLADVYLNGVFLGYANNMHRTWKYQVKKYIKNDNVLKVIFKSPTKFIKEAYEKAPTRGTEDAMDGFVHIRKAHYMFGWDWGAHLPDAGIWRPVYLLGIDKAEIESAEVLQYHEGG
ncbi:MAG: glycoside hydrolase family 2 protein, partial [Lachnospiraceae bacterium]|nr:glycoside hydrolase family 2 protein [Lachnospiraceae bacterium]